MCPGPKGTDTHGLVIGCVKGPWECEESLLSNCTAGSLGVGSRDPKMVLPFFWCLRCFKSALPSTAGISTLQQRRGELQHSVFFFSFRYKTFSCSLVESPWNRLGF